MATILARYGEIALKGKNRGLFEQQLQRNLKGALQDFSVSVIRHHGRFTLYCADENLPQVLERLRRIFGLVSFSPVYETELNFEEIKKIALSIVNNFDSHKITFKILARRSNKHFPYTSPEINQLIGTHLLQNFPELKVSLNNPEVTLFVEIGYEKAFLYLERIAGPGGLPVGITGRSLLLLSGGIDSPVAGWLALKRGLYLEAVHFHSFPYTGKKSIEKVRELCRKLALYGHKIPLHQIRVTKIQEELHRACPEELGIILLRRMMLRLAERLSTQRAVNTLITGENLGQVASQTLESIDVIDRATDKLILRPLIGFDKLEITDLAVKIDTYETSILPYDDCCTLFVPSSPVTKPKLAVVEKFEAQVDLELLLDEAFATLETKIIHS
jgi:tRNA uracil 4-sulfurtransferase